MSVSDEQRTGQWPYEIIPSSDVITISACATTQCDVHTLMASPVDGIKRALSLSMSFWSLAFQKYLKVEVITRIHSPTCHLCGRVLGITASTGSGTSAWPGNRS